MTETAKTKTASDHRLLITLNRIVAVLSIGAAIVLYTGEKSLGVPALSAAPHHEPIIVHCLLTALLLFYGNNRLNGGDPRSRLDVLAGWTKMLLLLGIASINLVLAGEAALKFDLGTAPALLLAISGVLGWWTFIAVSDASEKKNSEQEGVGQTQADDSQEADLQIEEPAPLIKDQLRYALVYTVLWAVFFTLWIPGHAYFYLLEDAIFDQDFRGWPHFFQWMQKAFIRSTPLVAAIIFMLFAYIAGAGAFAVLRRRRDQRAQSEARHEGTADFVANSFAQLRSHAERVSERPVLATATLIMWLLFAAVLIGGIILIIGRESGLGAFLIERLRTRGFDWYLYIDGAGAGDILAIFSIIMLFGCFWSWLGFFWPEFGAYGILEHRKREDDSENPWGYYRHALVRDLRKCVLDPNSEFDPAAYVRKDYWRFIRVWFIATSAVLVINLLFLYLDRMDYDLLTEDYIETTDYWTSKVHRFSYGDVERVEAACALDKDDDLELSYFLKFADGRTIRAIDLDTPRGVKNVLPKRLDAWTKVDVKLRAAGVPVRHADFDLRDCRDELDRLVGRELREKAMPLVRADRSRLSPE